MKKENFVAGLDIGSSKVTVIIGVQNENIIDVIGVGTASNQGLKRGLVVNIEQTAEAIHRARQEAELMAGVQLQEVWVGVGGTHIQSFDSRGMIAIRNKEIIAPDLERVVEAAKAVAVPSDREVIHVLPREYKVDDQDGIQDPTGMSGVRLEAAVHIVTAGRSAIQNLLRCIEKAGLKAAGFLLDPYASALATLTHDEKQLGVALVDLGGDSSDLIIIDRGGVAYTASIPLGGAHITNDIALGLRTPQQCAEELKRKYGCALTSVVPPEESIEVAGVGGRNPRIVLRQHLCEVIEPRIEETLNFIKNEIEKSKLSTQLGGGIVLTGGASLLDGIAELAEFIFDMPVRKATPSGVGGLVDIVKSPQYAAAVGILIYGFGKTKFQNKVQNPMGQWMTRIQNWIDSVL